MQLTFLGTGSAMPTGDRVQTGLLVRAARGAGNESNGPAAREQTDDDRILLVDCGSGVLHRLAQTDPGYEAVEHVLLTHHHVDHTSDLLALLKARWLVGEAYLTIAGPPGTEEFVDGLLDANDYLRGKVDLTVEDYDPGEFSFAGFDVEAVETVHSMRCHAYRLDDELTFSGDTEAHEPVAELADGSSVLVHDCSFPDEIDVSNHPTPSQLGRLLAETDVDVDTVYLSHLYPHTDGKHDEMLDSIGDHYDGDVQFARDGMQIEI